MTKGDLTIDLDRRIFHRCGEELHLTRKEHDVLAVLARHIGRVVTHDRIIAAAWGGETLMIGYVVFRIWKWIVQRIAFHDALLIGMLSFLLFAAAIQVDWPELRRSRLAVLVLSTVGVLLSTVLIGGGFYLVAPLLGVGLPLIWCLIFGGLISPTDPVAVTDALKRVDVNGACARPSRAKACSTTGSA